jgi:hypothetical protein
MLWSNTWGQYVLPYLKFKEFQKGIDEVLRDTPEKYVSWHWEGRLLPAGDSKTMGLKIDLLMTKVSLLIKSLLLKAFLIGIFITEIEHTQTRI